ncbi:hypothetical protein [Maricaulis sp.]|uniref:hypothetical protein n=1 Tax=Maricaulis sp. TaxID=1486257 RepID=UPI003A925007
MSDGFAYTLSMVLDDKALSIQLHGGCDLEASLVSLHALAETLANNPIEGLLMDYNKYDLTFEMEEFSKVADAYCTDFPEKFPVAFVYRESQVGRAIFMTRRLEETGRPSRAFESAEAALAWLETQLVPRVLPPAGGTGQSGVSLGAAG